MSLPILISFILLTLPTFLHCFLEHQQENSHLLPNKCNDTCGNLSVPFPFYLNTSCTSFSHGYHLSCSNSSSLYINIGIKSYHVLEFLSDGMLLDFPGSTTCRQYNDLNSFGFSRNDLFGVSVDNVIGLYDCEDSSLCKAECEINNLPGCDGSGSESLACCYPLSDHSVWHVGEGFSGFSKFGCRGFSSWVVPKGSNSGKRGVKLEWAVPRNISRRACEVNASVVNATTVEEGVRCICDDGFFGDGYADGTGCLKYCTMDGHEAYDKECNKNGHSDKKVVIIAGVLASALIIALLILLYFHMKNSGKPGTFDPEQSHYHSTISFRKACRTRLFTYHELQEATKGFQDTQKIVTCTNGTMYAGILGDGSHVAVYKAQCDNERELSQVLSRIEVLSSLLHKNMARLVGCCIDSGYTPLIVYDNPANGTLEEYLTQIKGPKIGLDWYKRLNIAAEIASFLAFLQHEFTPPIFHHDLKPGCIFLDDNFSVKVAGFELFSSTTEEGPNSCNSHACPNIPKSDVYDLGFVFLDIVSGSKHIDQPSVALQKIRSGKLEEIVDPLLYYLEQPSFRREQIEFVADIGTRCLIFGKDGELGMQDVAKDLVNITKGSIDGRSRRQPSFQETFSNSSLLQMASMSPDSIYVH